MTDNIWVPAMIRYDDGVKVQTLSGHYRRGYQTIHSVDPLFRDGFIQFRDKETGYLHRISQYRIIEVVE